MVLLSINSLQAICESKNCLDTGCDSMNKNKCAAFTSIDICNLLCSKSCNQCSTLLCGVNYSTSQYYCQQNIVRHTGPCGGEACGDATCKSNTCVIFKQKSDCESNCTFGCQTGIPGGDYTKSAYYCSQSNYTKILIAIIVDVIIAIAIIIIIPIIIFCVIKKKQQQNKELEDKENLNNASNQYMHEQVLFNRQQNINDEEQNSSQLKENNQLIKSRGQSRNSNNSINYLDDDDNQQQLSKQQEQEQKKQQPLQEVKKPQAPVKKPLAAAKNTNDVQRRAKRLSLNKNAYIEGGHVGHGTRDVDADAIKNSIKQMQEYERNKKNKDF